MISKSILPQLKSAQSHHYAQFLLLAIMPLHAGIQYLSSCEARS